MNRGRKFIVGLQLIAAPGSTEMQQALCNPHVCAIVDGLLYAKGGIAFRRIAQFLRENREKTNIYFAAKLSALRANLSARPGENGERTLAPPLEATLAAINELYEAKQAIIDYRRGAIVELLAGELIQGRCDPKEFFGNYRFVDSHYSSDQIDLIIHIPQQKKCEAYSCKMHPQGIKFADCSDLSKLVEHLGSYQYNTHIGTICFDNSRLIESRIYEMVEGIDLKALPKAYGLDNFFELAKNPFIS